MRHAPPHRGRRLAGLCLAAACTAGCSSALGGLIDTDRALWWSCPTAITAGSDEFHTTVQVRYLGTGGFLIRRGPDVILTAPFFSNPKPVQVYLPYQPNRGAIQAGLAPFSADLADVKAILVGHAHYDHLMDLPQAYRRWKDAAAPPPVFANETACHILAADETIGRHVTHLDDYAVTYSEPEDPSARWIRGPGTGADPHPEAGGVRILALTSVHGPQLGGKHLFKGDERYTRSTLPRRPADWKEGKTLAFLIDFLRKDGSVAFRVHYADSASAAPHAFIPKKLPPRRTDVAILCLGAYGQVPDYPGALLANVAPRHVVIGHWESFFRPAHKAPRSNPTSHPRGFLRRLESTLGPGAQYWLPAPRTLLPFPSSREPTI